MPAFFAGFPKYCAINVKCYWSVMPPRCTRLEEVDCFLEMFNSLLSFLARNLLIDVLGPLNQSAQYFLHCRAWVTADVARIAFAFPFDEREDLSFSAVE
jgi:hypothetical protein